MIALEPECAAVYVKAQKDKSKAFKSLTYAVVDCGGGTVDIAYHALDERERDTYVVREVTPPSREQSGGIREITPPSGGPFGGTLVDRAFEDLLEKIFGRQQGKNKHGETRFIDKLKLEHTDAWMDLMKEFEACKTALKKESKDSKPVRFRLDHNFGEACFEFSGTSASNLIKQCNVKGVSLSLSKMLLIEAGVLAALFTEPIECIQTCLNKGLRRLPDITAVYMVGSFSSCPLLFNAVQEKVTTVRKDNIIRPPKSGLAIVKGAVLYGFNPTIIQERISECSYGIEIFEEFDAGKHPVNRKLHVKSTGKDYCEDIYQEFLPCGGKIQNTKTLIKRSYVPIEPDYTNMSINVYCAPCNVRYIDDPGCRHLATIHVPMPDTTGGVNRTVQVEIEFDGPEIHIVCTDKNTGVSIDESIEFHYDKQT